MEEVIYSCPYAKKCGGCQYTGISYAAQLKKKLKNEEKLLKNYGRVQPVLGMEDPRYYRNKVHAVFGHDRSGNPLCGTYAAGTHRIVPIEDCLLEDEKCQEIIHAIRDMLKSFKIRTYDEDTGRGVLRHVLVRKGFSTGEIMVVLVVGQPQFPSRKNFVDALIGHFPEITTVVLNVNDKKTTFVLGEKEQVLYGPGYIKDELMGCTFRISPKSFYQVNPVQTKVLYQTAIDLAELTGKETVIDAYCGIGTIGLVAARAAGKVIGVELNPDAVADARRNAKENGIKNAEFYKGDAGRFMERMALEGKHADVVFMDPPRSGSTEQFMKSVSILGPKKVVYVSCGPESLARDLKVMKELGYQVKRIRPVDMFPFCEHCETVVLLKKA